MYDHIVVPLDGSHNSKLALSEALKLVKQFNAELTLVHVADDKRLIYQVTGTGIANTGGYYQELTDRANSILNEGKKIAADAGIDVKTEILHGNPKQVLAVNYPADHDVDLIVMGKSGTDAIDRLLVGSTTAAVVRNALTNVLVIAEPTSGNV
ncbi:universal stress protein [Secundilactobacillus folii]|uniref:Universal stress protein n=1 Tax=Secundilactobacillus folii TaxID=2678357 RepID=A0A7X2XW34_9LACO|nr:universal stress protein [Secundilactobacillus folii]MTV81973.1 universal stress protein [Secundilactobacillus folii]